MQGRQVLHYGNVGYYTPQVWLVSSTTAYCSDSTPVSTELLDDGLGPPPGKHALIRPVVSAGTLGPID